MASDGVKTFPARGSWNYAGDHGRGREQFYLGFRKLSLFLIEWQASGRGKGWDKVKRKDLALGVMLGRCRQWRWVEFCLI